MSEFGGINVALSALMAQRRGLEVTGNNVANANTEGYSRRRVDLASVGGPITGTFFSRPNTTGNGVKVAGITRFRDAFLEVSGAIERGTSGQLSKVKGVLGHLESLFDEPSDQSVAKTLNDFWSGWDDVANNPNGAASRDQLLNRGATLAATLNHASTQISSFRTQTIEELRSLTVDINSTAANIAQLNGAIRSAMTSGADASNLQDQRDILVQKLSEMTGASVRYADNGVANLFIGGSAIVADDLSQNISVDTSGAAVALRWTKSGIAVNISTGEAGGLLQVVNTTLPNYSSGLDQIALRLRDDVNALHLTGKGIDGGTGRKFFDATSAADIRISSDIGSDTNKIAAAAGTAGVLDGSLALDIGELASSTSGADSLYHAYIVNLGVESQSTQRRSDIQDAAVGQIDNERDASSSVSTDEEMVAMVQFQHAYEAAARYMTTVDEMLDTLINRTGSVGR